MMVAQADVARPRPDPGGQERLPAGQGRTGHEARTAAAQSRHRAAREIERLQSVGRRRKGGVDAAIAAKQAVEAQISTLLPAEKASAEAALAEAQVELDKTVVRAGVDRRVEQFALRAGDVVNPMMRPAGILIPDGAGRSALQAGFGQIEAQVMKVGMIAEVTCVSKPWTIIPMVVTERAGLHRRRPVPRRRPADRRAAGDAARHDPRFLEPLYKAASTASRRAAAASPTPIPATTR